MVKRILLLITHASALVLGISIGVYVLPILTAPPAPEHAQLIAMHEQAQYRGSFRRDLPGSDLLHWGEGDVAVGPDAISLMGELAPGPDYRLYLAPRFVDTAEGFMAIKADSRQIGAVRSFDGFILPLPQDAKLTDYDSVVIWCETFEKFISAAKYR